MVAIARKIIEQQEGPFDPRQFTDRYEEALRALIARKGEGEQPVSVQEPEDTSPDDLMAALRASLQGAGPNKRSAARRARSTPAKAANRQVGERRA